MSEIKTEHFKVFLEKHAAYHHKEGVYNCLKSIGSMIDTAKEDLDKEKLEMLDAAKACGIEVE